MNAREAIETLKYYDSHDESALEEVIGELEYYLDLEEQGRLIILASKEVEIKKLNEMCLNCKYYNGMPCKMRKCPVYSRLRLLKCI